MHKLICFAALFLGALSMSGQQAPAGSSGKPAPTARTNTPARPAPATKRTFEFKDGDRVVFLGDTFMEREQLESHIETRLTLSFPSRNVIFRNLGWSADTVLGESRAGFGSPESGFDRLKEHLAAVKPTVVFLAHGMAASFGGAAGLPKFREDVNKLMDTIRETAGAEVRFVIVGPIAHEVLGAPLPDGKEHNEQLKLYSDALRVIADQQKAMFVNLFAVTSALTKPGNKQFLTDNGIHLNSFGYWRVAGMIERALSLPSGAWRMGIGVDGEVRDGSRGLEIKQFQGRTNGYRLEALQAHHVPPPPPESGVEDGRQTSARIGTRGLPPGNYALKIDGVPVAIHTAEEWLNGSYFSVGPMADQIEELREVIQKKNELYFHRWRPANETYLFGFRKHEQGQNAREIPLFDPLVAEQEVKISQLRQLKTRVLELGPATEADRQGLATPRKKRVVAASPPAARSPQPQELPQFEMGPGLEVTLFAENPDLAKPIQMNFDTQGRLWVASSSVYPQIEPGQKANDKILILEDTNNDGKADRTTVFADGLLIPTGIEPGDGGVYVANSTELLHFKDTDGDRKADQKRVVLSGFGTEDTHHILHTLRWGHDGQLYFNQSIYIHSHIETPNGVVRLNSGGIFNFRPETMELGVHMKGLVNGWGHHFDRFGQSFATDGAGGEGINWVVPQGMYVTYAGARRILGSVSPGSYPKFCSLEVVESEHFPEDWQGSMVTCDFRAHRVVRFAVNDLEAGYVTKELPDVMRTTNVTFRPIDVKIGPDGALYVADWSNPIIQHGEVDFRDPRRDHEHGRIWRVSYKGRAALPKPDLARASNKDLLAKLASPNGYVRQRARRVLTERRKAILPDLAGWAATQTSEQGMLEALWMYQSVDLPEPALLEKALSAKDGRIRAAGARVLSFWRGRIPNTMDLLARLSADEHPRVRMEAMRALAKIPSARSAELVLAAVEKPMDKYLEYAAWLSINDLAKPWVEAIKSGAWKADGKEKQLAYGLNAIQPQEAAAVLATVLPTGALPRDGSGPWIELMGKSGGAGELKRLLEQVVAGGFDDAAAARALGALGEAARLRNARPDTGLAEVQKLFAAGQEKVRSEAVRLAGLWKLSEFTPALLALCRAEETAASVRQTAFQGLREMGGAEASAGLAELSKAGVGLAVRQQAVQTLAGLDLKRAAPLAVEVLTATTAEGEALALWRSLLGVKGAAPALTAALPKAGLPEVVARTGLRAAREGGRNEPNLVLAISRSLESEEAKHLTPEELKALINGVAMTGDPGRGELVYRRMELGCVGCHSIGGVGGKVGPDMTSIGASAPVDYLVESLQFPNRKVKEGYHSILIETKDEQEFSGILVRETDEQVVVRDASNKEVSIAKNNIAKRGATGSLMPAGLIDALSLPEQTDLYRFLSELGKPGPYDASKGNVARSFKLLAATIDLAQFGDERVIKQSLSEPAWVPAATLVNGTLLQEDLKQRIGKVGGRAAPAVYAAAQFTAARDGVVRLKIEGANPLAVYVNGVPAANPGDVRAELKAGQHTVIVKLDAKHLPDGFRVLSDDATFLN